jgi:hypothetical protein
MYSRKQLLKALDDPSKVVREVRRQVGAIQNRLAGDRVMDEDWDNLIILDACRYDTFVTVNDLDGHLERWRSAGSATMEFLENNFWNGPYHDTVYVSANPHVTSLDREKFHNMIDVWYNDWNDNQGTVLPETMTERCVEYATRYPNKKLICHYIQPHHPFLGPTADRELPDLQGNDHARRTAIASDDSERDHVWRRLARGDLNLNIVERAYRETLERTLASVQDLLNVLPGKTIITSDHGNLFDEPAYRVGSFGTRRHDHPIYATAAPLVTVPWLIFPHETRKNIVVEPPTGGNRLGDESNPNSGDGTDSSDDGAEAIADADVVEDRLAALGYK